MGFYAPSQLVQDARRHGVEVRPVNVLHSNTESSLESIAGQMQPALRLGLHMVKGLSQEGSRHIISARAPADKGRPGFIDVHDLKRRAGLNRHDMSALAAADALHELAGHRYRASWEVTGILSGSPLVTDMQVAESEPLLRKPLTGESVIADYRSTGLTLGPHPVSLLRKQLRRQGILSSAECRDARDGRYLSAAGLVIGRQRPGTASGVVFVTLEDEYGPLNVIVWSSVADRYNQALLRSRLMLVKGQIQHQEGVLHLVAGYLDDYSDWLNELPVKSRDFH
jgi:error-prone DNA polymerase